MTKSIGSAVVYPPHVGRPTISVARWFTRRMMVGDNAGDEPRRYQHPVVLLPYPSAQESGATVVERPGVAPLPWEE